MSFFDTTPLGRIVNRFSKDVDGIDVTIPSVVHMWLYCLLHVCSTLVVISISTPLFLVVIVPLMFLYYFVQVIGCMESSFDCLRWLLLSLWLHF